MRRKSSPIGHNLLIASALEYAQNGIPILTVNPETKAPLNPGGYKNASTDPDVLLGLLKKHPNPLIAIPTGSASGFVSIDIDMGTTKNGEESFNKLGLGNPDTIQVKTPSGGRHLHFKNPSNIEVRNDTGRILGSWIDIRGEGGYIIVPPSCSVRGCYTYIEGYEPWNMPLAPLPEVVQEKILAHQQGASKYTNKSSVRGEMLSPIAEGERNHQLTRRCGFLFKKLGAWKSAQVRLHIHEINQKCCQPPLGEREVDAIWTSILKKEARNV